MHRMRLLFLLAALFTALTAGIAKVRDLAPYTPPVPNDAPLVVTALLPTYSPTLTLAPTATPPIVRTPKAAQPVATVKADPVIQVIVTAQPGLNVRDAPAGHVVGSLRTGAVLSVKPGAEWAEVVAGEYRGKFVAAKYLRAK